MLVLAPIMCILSGIALSSILGIYIRNLDVSQKDRKAAKFDKSYIWKNEARSILFCSVLSRLFHICIILSFFFRWPGAWWQSWPVFCSPTRSTAPGSLRKRTVLRASSCRRVAATDRRSSSTISEKPTTGYDRTLARSAPLAASAMTKHRTKRVQKVALKRKGSNLTTASIQDPMLVYNFPWKFARCTLCWSKLVDQSNFSSCYIKLSVFRSSCGCSKFLCSYSCLDWHIS